MPRGSRKRKQINPRANSAEMAPALDVACETCTVDGCRHRADGKHCTRWERREAKICGVWTVVQKGRKLTEAEKARQKAEPPRQSWWKFGAWR